MIWKRIRRYLSIGMVCLMLAAVGIGEWSHSASAPDWLRMVSIEIQVACRDAGTQWMVVICLVSYFIVFVFLERRILPQESTKTEDEGQSSEVRSRFSFFARLVPFCGKSSDVLLIGFVALVLLRYAFDYTNAAKSLQVVVLLTGIVVGKGIALWARGPKANVSGLDLLSLKA